MMHFRLFTIPRYKMFNVPKQPKEPSLTLNAVMPKRETGPSSQSLEQQAANLSRTFLPPSFSTNYLHPQVDSHSTDHPPTSKYENPTSTVPTDSSNYLSAIYHNPHRRKSRGMPLSLLPFPRGPIRLLCLLEVLPLIDGRRVVRFLYETLWTLLGPYLHPNLL